MNTAILLSGGNGSRTGEKIPKQYIRARGSMMITHAAEPLLLSEHTDRVVIVASEEWRDAIREDIAGAGLRVDKLTGFYEPGENRQLSIFNALKGIMAGTENGEGDTVLIHDGARPFLSLELLDRCYAALEEHDGVMPVLGMKDTVYRSRDGKTVEELMNRGELFAGQAPELFRLLPYYEANLRLLPERILKINGSSEPAIAAGMDIVMVPGDENNYKVTTDSDLRRFLNHSVL